MRLVHKGKDKGASEIIGYVLIFAMVTIMICTVILVYVPYSASTNLNNYESQALSSMTALQNQLVRSSNINSSQYTQVIPMGVKGSFFSKNAPTSIGFNSGANASLSYSLGLNIQVEGHQSNVVNPYNKVIGSVDVGHNPDGVVYDPDNGYIYVINHGYPYSISVINGGTNTVVGTAISLPEMPLAVAYDSFSKDLLVTLYGGGSTGSVNELAAISTANGQIMLSLNSTTYIFLDVSYDAASGAALVSFLDQKDYAQSGIAVFNASNFLTVYPPINYGYNWLKYGYIAVPSSLTYDPSNGLVYVAGAFNIWGIDAITYQLVNKYPNYQPSSGPPNPAYGPWAVAFDPSSGNLYVTAGTSNGDYITPANSSQTLYIYDGVNTNLLGSASTQKLSTSVLYDPGNRYVYVSNFGSNTVSIYNGQNTSEKSPIENLRVGTNPGAGFMSMAYDPSNGNVYVANYGSGNVSVIEGNTNISSGWGVQNSKLGLNSDVSGGGSISLTSSDTFSGSNVIILQDGSLLEQTQTSVAAQSTLPFVFNATTGLFGLTTNVVNMEGPGNFSTSSTTSTSVALFLLEHEAFSITQGQLVTLVNGSQTIYSLVLHLDLLTFAYSIHTIDFRLWNDVFYHAYNSTNVSDSTINSLSSWNFSTLPLRVTVNSNTQTIEIQKISGSVLTLTSFLINYYSYDVKFTS